jgi:hypothetical protein
MASGFAAASAGDSATADDLLAAGCLEVWSVDPGSRTVTVHTASHGSRLVGEADSFRSTGVPGLSVRLADLLPPSKNA